MDINDLKSQPKICVQQELIDQSNEQGNQIIQSLPTFQTQDYGIDQVLQLFHIKKKDIELKNIKLRKKFQCKQLKSQRQNNRCYAFAFNKKGNILFQACRKTIIVYFNGYIRKMLKRLTNHTNNVYCLYYMKNSNSLVSGSDDKSIIIWELNKFNKQSMKQLKGHKNAVFCILMNKSEDLLISGSLDNTVKFWRQNDNGWSCQQTIDLEMRLCSLSLNEKEEKLISCGDEPFIYVMQIQQDHIWIIVQIIEVIEDGRRLYFLNDHQFIFQPFTKNFIEMYYFDNELSQFNKHKNIKVQNCENDWLFPIQFIKDLKILTVKHGRFLNIFSVQDDGDINLIQTIDFKDETICGNLTDDGKYLTTWDEETKEIQIRQLRYLE